MEAMKFLAVLFLVGLELSYAVPVPSNEENSLVNLEELHYIPDILSLEIEFEEERGFGDWWDKTKKNVGEWWEKKKEFFRKLMHDLEVKYSKFGNWVKKTFKKGLEEGKTKAEYTRQMAIEFVKHAADVSEEVAIEAIEFFKEHKEEIEDLRDIVHDLAEIAKLLKGKPK